MLWVQTPSWLFSTTRPTLPQRKGGLKKNPNCIVLVTLDCGVKPPLPIAQMGLLRPPGEGELQAAVNQRGSWEAARPCRLSLEATACISSSHWCLGEAWAAGRQALP